MGRATWEQDKGGTFKKTTHTYSILNYPQFSVVGGVDSDYSQCVSWSQEFSLPSLTNLKKAVMELEPEFIVVAVPIAKLTEVLQQVLEFSTAVILIEKPVASNFQDLQSLRSLHSEFSRILVNLPRLLAPETLWLRNFVRGREFNQVTVSGSYSGTSINTGLHFISLMDYFFEKLVWRVPLSHYEKSFEFQSPSGLVNGIFKHDITRSDSSFQFEIKSADYRVSYLEGGSSLTVFEGFSFQNIQTTRASYQDNVYRELVEKGISSTLDLVGLNVIIKSICGLLS